MVALVATKATSLYFMGPKVYILAVLFVHFWVGSVETKKFIALSSFVARFLLIQSTNSNLLRSFRSSSFLPFQPQKDKPKKNESNSFQRRHAQNFKSIKTLSYNWVIYIKPKDEMGITIYYGTSKIPYLLDVHSILIKLLS